MTFAVACVWSFVRSMVVATLGVLIARRLRSALSLADGWQGRWLWAMVLLPLFVPGLLIGYGYRNFSLSLIHHPVWNELAYAGLVLLTVVPVGTLILACSPPPPVSESALHIAQEVRRNEGASRFLSSYGCATIWMRARLFAVLPAWTAMFLLTFQETEVATLMQAHGWPEWTFTRLASGLPLAQTMLRLVGPLAIQSIVIAAALLLVLGESRRHPMARRGSRPHAAVMGLGWSYAIVAVIGLLVLPGAFVLRGMLAGFGVLSAHPALIRQIGIGLLFGVTAGMLAWLLSGWIVGLLNSTSGPSAWRTIFVVLLLMPGLMGAWALGLMLAELFQTSLLRPLAYTPLPMIAGEVLYQLPRAVVVRLLLGQLADSTAVHSANLLSGAGDRRRRRRAADILWQLDARGRIVGGMIICYWAYMELSIPSTALLGPPGMTTAPVLLYNQMHYGQIPGLSALVFAAIAIPVVLLMGLSLAARLIPRWLRPK